MRIQLLLLISFSSLILSLAPGDEVTGQSQDTFTYSNPTVVFDRSTLVVDKKSKYFDSKITSKELIDEMGFGWNLGNTFDAFDNKYQDQGLEAETSWGVHKTTEESIEGLYSKGIRTIRIPVTWHNHLIDNSYTIDPEWMKRVKTVVDWSIGKGLYVILNTHHDNAEHSEEPIPYGKGYYPARKDLRESTQFLYNVWTQIASAFNNGYDHHLIFEGLNEPRPIGTDCEWTYTKGNLVCEEAATVVNEFSRIILKAIRESGGNNEKRFFMVTPLAAAYGAAVTSNFILPGDSKYNPLSNQKVLVSVHMYLPYNFAMNADMSFVKFEEAYKNEVVGDFKTLFEKFTLKGHRVIIGEMGTTNKNNTDARIEWAKMFIENSRKYQMCSVIWDNEYFDNTKTASEVFGNYHRDEQTWENDTLIDTYVQYSSTPFIDTPREEFKDSLLESPMEFNDWSLNFPIGMGVFSSFNSYSKLCLTTEDSESFNPQYRSMILFLGDWSDKLNITEDEMKGANFYELGSVSIRSGTNNVEITLNEKNMKLAKERGLIIIGYGFTISKLFISGPKLAGFEPMTLTKSSEKQKVKFFFSEDATLFENGIEFVNDNYNLNKYVKCILSEVDVKIIECSGVFNYTGEYQVTDKEGVLLSSLAINVIPAKGEKYDRNNLIETKAYFDDLRMLPTLHFPPSVLDDLSEDSILVVETDGCGFRPSQRTMFLFRGDSMGLLNYNSTYTNVDVAEDGGIAVPEGKGEIRIKLSDMYKKILDTGFNLKGYGFSVNGVFLE